MTGPVKRFLREVAQNRKRRKDKATIDVRADGFTYTSRRKPVSLAWDALTKISAGTHAMVSGEVFYVAVEAPGVSLEIDEFTDGFNSFETALGERYAGAREKLNALQTSVSRHDRLVELWSAR